MSNFLARCAVIGIVGGGFAATGDLGWLAARGLKLVNARTIPSEETAAAEPATGTAAAALAPAPLTAPTPLPVPSAPAGVESAPTVLPPAPTDPFRSPPATGPVAPPAGDPSPPSDGPKRIDLATLGPGTRVTVWIGRPTIARQPWISFDLVDPAAGEALLFTPGMAARRVTIRAGNGGQGAVVARGDTIVITPVGPAHHGPAGGASLGPVTAVAIGR